MKTKDPKLAKLIGRNLLDLSVKRGYKSLHELAKKNNLKDYILYEIRRGERIPTISTLGKIAKALHVKLDDFVKGYDFKD